MRSRRSVPPLVMLMRAIVAGDRARAQALLHERGDLATSVSSVGATRAAAPDFFLEEIRHYIYAGDTALHVAAAAHDIAMVRTLLRLGAKTSAKNRRGAEPLHYAVDGGPGIGAFRPSAQVAVVKYLLEHGADPDARDKGGVTPLHRAVRNRCAGAVRALLDAGADVALRTTSGSTALDLTRWTTGRSGSGSAEARAAQAMIVELLQTSR